MYQIRKANPADYDQMVIIRNLAQPEPVTAEQFRQWDELDAAHPRSTMTRLVAVDPAARIVGYAFSEHLHHMPDGRWGIGTTVHPESRGRGIGQLLYAEALRIALEGGASELTAYCRGEDDASFAWAQRRGFHMDRQRTESVLDLTTFEISRFAGHVEQVEAGGIRFVTMMGAPEDEQMLHSLYLMDNETALDIPAFDNWQLPDYETWRKEVTEEDSPKYLVLALDGDRVVGSTWLILPTVEGAGAYNGYTGTLREYRGRGIALALKLMATREALSRGIRHIRTNNDPDNPPMLAVNGKMGYQLQPGPRYLKQKLTQSQAQE